MEKIQNPGTFEVAIRDFNTMYALPVGLDSWKDTPAYVDRPVRFQSILAEEVAESRDILLGPDPLDHATALCDWLGDIVVYCASEAVKYDAFQDLVFAPNLGVLDPLLQGLEEVAQRGAGQDLALIVRIVDDHARQYLDAPSKDPRQLPISITQVAISGFSALGKRYADFSYWDVLDIIMASNFSKLGADGKPIYDERGKVMKGPGYWKPEPKILEYLTSIE